jgi:hypothetical protein
VPEVGIVAAVLASSLELVECTVVWARVSVAERLAQVLVEALEVEVA